MKERIPTMKDIAEQTGVSTSTVSHVLNETRSVSDATKERIIGALQSAHYAPNPAGRNLGRSVLEGEKDKKRVTMHDVAERAGVSTTTVSHVLNNTRFVTEGTRQNVIKGVTELGYTINPDAQALRKRKKHDTNQNIYYA